MSRMRLALDRLQEVWKLEPSVQEYFARDEAQALLLADRDRLLAFDKVFRKIRVLGRVVADIGAGTGILSSMALRAGAEHVIVIEQNRNLLERANAHLCKRFTRDRFTICHGNYFDLELSGFQPVDVVVSETIGTLGFNEGVYPILVDAVSRLLSPSGVLLPRQIELFACEARLREPSAFFVPTVSRRKVALDELMERPICVFSVSFMAYGLPKTLHAEFTISASPGTNALLLWSRAHLASDVYLDNGPSRQPNSFGYLHIPVVPSREHMSYEFELADQSLVQQDRCFVCTISAPQETGGSPISYTLKQPYRKREVLG